MSPLPVIPLCFRVALEGGSYGGVKPINVFHVLSPAEDVADVAIGLAASSEQSGMLGGRPESAKPINLHITPLDGVSSAYTLGLNSDQFPTDTGNGQMVPEAACVISFKTGLRGPANRGRLYNGPLVESVIENGFVDSSITDGIAGAWATFIDVLQLGDPAIFVAVASYKNEEANPVTSVTCGTQMATQRRRLLQTR